ncbi:MULTISPECIES: bifunctional 3,4-dihydroxy-2-butanone-4-phosphate synthase/GTP cyclohydrolase II [unclassified Idiomarina]|jgi:3,4-dihydroxy 2-butanone 4-phosphate synthase/GTP cyclohydrolase II|uniref:bifunctional 3,4-dihydroxy-2-butanone-4-phosphate synthase/GTP cyclohydrolase II n=1 Tax=unclassified Idiomarina TaxID=2614829 RepID=UPI0008F7F1DA|nr:MULTISPECIES: bifunctional 3,4-dihydroxy-2-butanone-4-phosphate synthase/GTP cyclohydrolase II [unclassified Idiomarina]MAD53902.1 bifunctional 3,4-dihydroxy-2-butanone-4-phosphate synthase/GTP cyclohydrolase II [Idiomarinaceae bacterium]MEC7643168.1 bifunctional 3,4-dihydroxy-2-butanone-4-phosphate synthase/GTP cyclohydrolase II [Pseudomonadota bacterium]MEC9318446.1 bifunctional 3,4-dihydroxy-2-butanone-4-phosphate synthase/GTP cyclohydrolase II [Pseudomonadota bacterium]NQZ04071.1 bifunct|tara:strand:- start:4165 stop:5283 length:1119 start_codon:yes stop_codon:yes gene_type:complete
MSLHSTEEIIEDIKQGKMVILMDDEDRENEGDLILAADCVTPEAINFMARYGRGLICLTLSEERCKQLNLPLMVDRNNAPYSTAFTVSIEAAEGVTTGISAADRAQTVKAAVARNAQPEDLVMPGHIFPLKAKQGGVLNRAGHTEAGCDLARLAGYEPAAVIVEVLNEDGTMARRADLEKFAEAHDIKVGTIADLIEYRSVREKTIRRVAQCQLPTSFGKFNMITYQDSIDQQVHHALVHGEIDAEKVTNVRVHLQDSLHDTLSTERAAKRSWPIAKAMQYIAENDGVLVLIGRQQTPEDIIAQVKEFEAQDQGQHKPTASASNASRNVGVGSQILADLGIHQMHLLSSPKRYSALSGFGLEVVDFIEDKAD